MNDGEQKKKTIYIIHILIDILYILPEQSKPSRDWNMLLCLELHAKYLYATLVS